MPQPLDVYAIKIAQAEVDLGELSEDQRVDLLLDNFHEISNSKVARQIVRAVVKAELL
jgi:hypothetical protein